MKKNKNSVYCLEFMRRLLKGWSSRLGFILLLVILLLCLFGPLFSPYGVNDIDLLNMYAGPCKAHWFGCDSMGRDIFTRLLYGGRYSLLLGFSSALLSAAIGIVFGIIAGYFGGKTETFIMRFMDIWSALPGMLLCIMISAFMGAGFFATVIALTVGSIPGGVRMTRGQVLSERKKEYIEAAESINASKPAIMFRHLLPNVIQPPTPEWGAMLADGRAYIRNYPFLITFPGLAIALTVLALNLLGDGLRDALDPKLRD